MLFRFIFVNRTAEETSYCFSLPLNNSHKTQTLDKAMFGLLKRIGEKNAIIFTKKTLVKVLQGTNSQRCLEQGYDTTQHNE